MKLTASWKKGRDPSADAPSTIRWEDGRRGTVADLRAHNRDTYCLPHPEDGSTQMDIFPEIIGEAFFCEFGGCWGVRGEGVEATALRLTDRNATDQQIYSAVFSLPIKYRVNIQR